MSVGGRVWLTFLSLVLATSCSGEGGTEDPSTTSEAPTTSTAQVATTTAPPVTTTTQVPLRVDSLDRAADAIGRVTTTGTFVLREGSPDIAGTGLATVVHPSGLAVTTARAVLGADSIAVTFGSELGAVPATIEAYDECANLALLKLEQDDMPYLEIADGTSPGAWVYAASRASDSTFSIREGLLETLAGHGTAAWVSVDSLMEHTADFPAGTSGAPLLDEDGRLVGINHIPGTDRRHSAVPAALIHQLIEERPTRGLGINSVSVTGPYETGELISAIEPSSVLASMGVLPGEVIVSIDGQAMAPDGDRAAYCSVVDTAVADQAPIDVLNERIPSRWIGAITPDVPLERDFDLNRDLAYMLPNENLPAYEMTLFSSEHSEMEMVIPAPWSDRKGGNWVDKETDERFGLNLTAAVDYDVWVDVWNEPGVFLGRSSVFAETHTAESYLDANTYSACTHVHRVPIAAGAMEGHYDLLFECGDVNSVFLQAALLTPDQEELIVLQVALVDERDIPALNSILETFDVFTSG